MGRLSFAFRSSLLAAVTVTCAAAHAQFQGPPPTSPVPPTATGPAGVANLKNPNVADMTPFQTVKIVPGDEMDINVIGITYPEPPTPGSGQAASATSTPIHQVVNSDGRVMLPYIGSVDATGLTPIQLAGRIRDEYSKQGYIKEAQVTVTITSAPTQQASVLGEVNSAGTVPIPGQRSLLEMIAGAGGFKPTASHLVTIRRANGTVQQVLIDPNPLSPGDDMNIPIYPGDTVIVARSGQVYVVGSVHAQQAIPLQANTPFTVIQALTAAGGPGFEAALSKTVIIRTEGHQRKEITMDVKKILHGDQPDPILQADDIVYVPGNYFKSAIKGGGVTSAFGLFYALSYLSTQ